MKKRMICMLITLVMCMGTLSVTVGAELLENNPYGVTVDVVASGEGMPYNYGTVTTNNGIVNTNDGTVKTNNCTVRTNNGTVTMNTDWIGWNYGTVETNENGAYLNWNHGTVKTNVAGGILEENHADLEINNGTVQKNFDTGTVTKNGETGQVDTNDGMVNTNNGLVSDNNGTVEINRETVSMNAGTVKTNMDTVTTNVGTVETNDGTVKTNADTVRMNNKDVLTNNSTGAVDTNGENAWVATNEGMVHTNDGTVSGNSGVVETNNGIVEHNIPEGTVKNNFGTVTNNSSTVTVNNGTVETNIGTVEYNYGTVTNFGGTVLYNLGGTVRYNQGGIVMNDTSADYFKLEGFSGEDLQLSGNFVKHDGVYWLKKDGTAAIEPGASGYFLTELTVTGGSVSQNSDGSFAIASDGDAVTIEDMEMLAVSGGEAGVDYTFANGALHIGKAGNYVLSGRAKGIVIAADGQVNLTFDGVAVTAPEGDYAMEVDSGKVNIQLKAGTENKLDGGITIEESIRDQMGVRILVDGSLAINGKVDDLVPIIPREGMRMEVKVGADADTAKAVAGSPFTDGRLLKTEDIDLSGATNVVELKGYDYVYFGEAADEPVSVPKKKTPKYDAIIEQTENGDVKVNDDHAKRGQEITITVKPDEGYELDELIITDEDGDEIEWKDKGDGRYSFVMPRGDVEIEASFVEITADVPAAEEDDETEIILTIDNKTVLVDGEAIVNDVAPVIRGERTYLPIRVVAEELGAAVAWNEPEQTVTITKDDLEIVIYISQPFAVVNGEPVQLDAPAFIDADRTYLPIRFVAEKLGAEVIWNDTDGTVTIRSAE